MDRSVAATSLLDGPSYNSDKAIALASQLIQKDPGHAREYGNDLASSLVRTGDFASAARFAVTGTGEVGSAWITTAYSQWAE